MGKIVGVRFRPGGKIYNFDAGLFVLSPGSHVIVETEQGLAFGTVVTPPVSAGEQAFKISLKMVYRLANDEDLAQHRKNVELEKSAHTYCLKCIDELGLEMNLVSVQSLFDGTKLTFYYTADSRVDFRELVKMLVKAYRVRIEMRQIGVRNRAKMCDGVGRCGHELCCSAFMKDFEPVSIRMAKEQGLLLNPTKISGLCGRLMCCLAFEYDAYCDHKRKFPDCGKRVRTKMGSGKVVRQNVLKNSITIKADEGHEFDVGLNEIIEQTNS
ncbi:MAG: stage 0 sporulation family protein [Deltaproteobacteria bacterium]|nr:stage 0 sporulation family protein [Deltaproteobacteria bacterium]MBW2018640.1 stage 0 sporulation family protein [Deltaproteobacteria bacterium]MBW2073906.1 stage 0 sporulation family protein [Deltaproteobacteria bacterium]RLB81867.1 MAG: stage 0 sporulation protein [Deltaproteobacteria bacterium]